MKRQPFLKRVGFAWDGISYTWRSEPSFRFQALGGLSVLAFLVVTKPAPIWWATMALIISAILSAELFNTAMEKLLDHIHPELHGAIRVAKDCAAAAVLILSLASLGIFGAYLLSLVGP